MTVGTSPTVNAIEFVDLVRTISTAARAQNLHIPGFKLGTGRTIRRYPDQAVVTIPRGLTRTDTATTLAEGILAANHITHNDTGYQTLLNELTAETNA